MTTFIALSSIGFENTYLHISILLVAFLCCSETVYGQFNNGMRQNFGKAEFNMKNFSGPIMNSKIITYTNIEEAKNYQNTLLKIIAKT